MIKKLLPLFLTAVFAIFLSQQAMAQEAQFAISVASEYLIEEDGNTNVTQEISITNRTEFYYTPTYTVTVGFDDIENIVAYNADGSIPTTIEGKGGEKSIKLTFPKRYAGLNQTNKFTLKFSTKDIAKKQGSIWEVMVPGIDKPDKFVSYNTQISVPESFGKASILKPAKEIGPSNIISLTKEEVGEAGIYVLYGERQYYSYQLTYNISNPNLFPVRTEIALPPKTNYQNVYISQFSESPENVTKDFDGNWIAEYRLLPQQKKQIKVTGYIELFSEPQQEELTSRQLKEYTSYKKYWEASDPSVKREAATLETPRQIYDYVVKKLSYNYSKIATENLRLGGKGALQNPSNSVCLEFADLFVALARSKGIPARLVEGYAYTQNTKLRPLSLVNDVLHAWPEYYDFDSKKWIMVDPTWGNTTNGMDYYESLDFSHVAFVIKGLDSEYPIPAGGYKFNQDSKDVDVKFASASEVKNSAKLKIEDNFPAFSFPRFSIRGDIIVTNTGNIPLSGLKAIVATSKGTKKEFEIDFIPPGGKKTITTAFSDTPFLTNEPYVITIQIGENVHTKTVRISFIPDIQWILIIGGILGGSAIIAAVTFHTGSVLVQRRKRKNSLRR